MNEPEMFMLLNNNAEEVMAWLVENKCPAAWEWDDGLPVYLETLEGTMTVEQGDLIIKGVNGEFYHCKPEAT